MTTPNMSLVLPTDHGSSDVWDVVLDAVFTLIDSHNHTTGKGVQVPSAGIGINADLTFAGFSLRHVLGVSYDETANAPSTVGTTWVKTDHNLYFHNSAGVDVQITSGNTLNVSIVGGIGGDYSSVGALLSFDDATQRYLLQSEGSPRPWSGLATADIDLYQKAASIVNRVRQKSPSSLAASYDMTWFTALPAGPRPMFIDNTGAMTTSAGFVFLNRQKLTAGSGTYTPTSGTRAVIVRMVAGGGGGGGVQGASAKVAGAGGGASGQYLEVRQVGGPTVTGGAYTVGSGGAGGTGSGGNTGTTGGDSTIVINGGTYTCKGGIGGNGAVASDTASATGAGAVQGGGSQGDFSAGSPGGAGFGATGAAGFAAGGHGGANPFGQGGLGGVGTQVGGPAFIVNAFGGGGGGAATITNVNKDGGNGASGLIIVDEFQ